MNQKSRSYRPRQPWPLLWVWIFLTIIIVGLTSPHSIVLTCIKLGGIFLCFIYTVQQFPSSHLLQLALLATFIADIFLAINNTSNIGLLIFLSVQIIHAWRLSPRNFKPIIFAFCGLAIATIILNYYFKFVPSIYVICTCYATALITNVILCWQWQCQQPNNPYAKFGISGFILFIFCDACTGTSYLSLIGAFPSFLYAPANFLAWAFYYPSQVFISNSPKSLNSSKPNF